jgi:NitT/TauT family transport system substrate-binding protein
VAQEKGYFEEQGLNIEFEFFRTGDSMGAPLSLRQLDVGVGKTGPALFNAINMGLDVGVFAGLAQQMNGIGGAPLLVRTDLFESGVVTAPGCCRYAILSTT